METINKKYLIFVLVAVVLIGLGTYFFTFIYKNVSKQQQEEINNNQPTAPVFKDVKDGYEVISFDGNGNYKAKDLKTGKEVNLIIPSGADFIKGSIKAIKKGSRIEAQKIFEAANGILITRLSVS